MRLLIVAATALMVASPVSAQSAPYKLIVLRGDNGIAITDYRSAASCEAARVAIQQLMDRENQGREPRTLPNGGVILQEQLILKPYCIPG